MVGPLAALAQGQRRKPKDMLRAGTQAAEVLAVLRARPGRMLPRRELHRLLPHIPPRELSRRLLSLELAGRIVVDREERPLLYGVLR